VLSGPVRPAAARDGRTPGAAEPCGGVGAECRLVAGDDEQRELVDPECSGLRDGEREERPGQPPPAEVRCEDHAGEPPGVRPDPDDGDVTQDGTAVVLPREDAGVAARCCVGGHQRSRRVRPRRSGPGDGERIVGAAQPRDHLVRVGRTEVPEDEVGDVA
jgi:hypothetical protein